MYNVILIGDSIRMGYQETVTTELKDEAEIWGPTKNGGDSRNVLGNLEEWALSRSASIVHLNCGLHDIKRAFDSEQHQVPIAEYESNLREIFSKLCNETKHQVIWATTTPVNQVAHRERKSFDRFEEDVDAYNKVAARVAAEFNLPTDPLFDVVTEAGRDNIQSGDGVHYSEDGSQILGKAVAGFIRTFQRENG